MSEYAEDKDRVEEMQEEVIQEINQETQTTI
jgi:hypothetical protein